MNLIRIKMGLNSSSRNKVQLIESELLKQGTPLRWYIVDASKDQETISITVEAIMDESGISQRENKNTSFVYKKVQSPVIVHVVPTGIGASVGGSLGDAMPVNLFLSKIGTLITHPNSCNGGPLLLADHGSFMYVEGYSLDEWMKGNLVIQPTSNTQKIGVVLDGGADQRTLDRAINAINGFYAHTGSSIIGIQKTKDPVNPSVFRTENGVFTGNVDNMETIFDSVEKLIEKGANRIALFTHVKVSNDDWTEYFKGKIPNPVGGVEALMSHLVSKKYGIMSAHGPLVSQEEEIFIQSVGVVSSESALEAASPFYLWCVLRGLQDSPDLGSKDQEGISANEVSVVICPASVLGGIPMIKANELGKPILAVKNNTTVLDVSNENLNMENVIEIESFIDVAGLLVRAVELGDFSTNTLRSILSTDPVNEIGLKFINECGVDPQSVLRPSKTIPLYE